MARRSGLRIVLGVLLAASCAAAGDSWRTLEPGLELADFSVIDDDRALHVLRIDPERFDLVLLNSTAPGEGELNTARSWARDHDLVAAINASMYQQDYRTSVSLMRTREHVNNTYVSKDNTVLAFDPIADDVDRVAIIDRTCEDFATIRTLYGSLVQGIRMVSCHRNNTWSQQRRRHATSAIGLDAAGRILLIFCARPLSTHDLINRLLAEPLGLERCMYTEGGPPSQLYVNAGGEEHEYVGGIVGGARLGDAYPVPNVVGVRRR